MIKQALIIMKCSRIFSLPMTIMSWFVIFVYSLINSGNVKYGLIALIGLCFAHLGTNLIDDYFDYKLLIKQVDYDKEEYLKNTQKTKCRYLINGIINQSELLIIIATYFFIAGACGLFLFIKCGIGVLYFALAGAAIAILYPFASRICLSEVMVGLAYGPALFGGVYYVMNGTFSNDIYLLSIPSTFMTIVLLYIHTVMDYDFDLSEGKKTIANIFNSQLDSLIILKWLLLIAYISPVFLCVLDLTDWQVFLVYLTIPMAVDLYRSLQEFACNPESIPQKKWYHFPMENLNEFKTRGEAPFMIRMFQSRNLMIYFSSILTIGLAFALAL